MKPFIPTLSLVFSIAIRAVGTTTCLALPLFLTAEATQGSILSDFIERNTRSLPLHAKPKQKAPSKKPSAPDAVVEDIWDLTPAVLNVSHYDKDTDRYFKDAVAGKLQDAPDSQAPVRLELIIHKATDGITTDPKYAGRQKLATVKNYLWGAYHYAEPSVDALAQANTFLETVKQNIPDRSKRCSALLVLDLEYYPGSKRHFGVKNALTFVRRVKEVTGNYPGLYIGQEYLKDQFTRLSSEERDAFGQCWLWVPRYYERFPEIPATAPWKTWKMWQFTADAIPPRATVLPGNGGVVLKTPELSFFRGSRPVLKRWYAQEAWTYYDPKVASKAKSR